MTISIAQSDFTGYNSLTDSPNPLIVGKMLTLTLNTSILSDIVGGVLVAEGSNIAIDSVDISSANGGLDLTDNTFLLSPLIVGKSLTFTLTTSILSDIVGGVLVAEGSNITIDSVDISSSNGGLDLTDSTFLLIRNVNFADIHSKKGGAIKLMNINNVQNSY